MLELGKVLETAFKIFLLAVYFEVKSITPCPFIVIVVESSILSITDDGLSLPALSIKVIESPIL